MYDEKNLVLGFNYMNSVTWTKKMDSYILNDMVFIWIILYLELWSEGPHAVGNKIPIDPNR